MLEIELAGGEHDGKRFTVPDSKFRDRWLMPVLDPLRGGDLLCEAPEGQMPPMPPDPLVYEFAGTRDDGTRWFQLRHPG